MQLRLRRSQRASGLRGNIIFCLDARAYLSPQQQDSIARYKLGGQVIYNSEAAKKHLEQSKADLSEGTAGGYLKSIARTALAAMRLNITIDSLQRGHHIECKSLDELLSAEESLVDACKHMKEYLDVAATFDGREVLFDFSDTKAKVLAPTSPSSPPQAMASPALLPPSPQPEASTPPLEILPEDTSHINTSYNASTSEDQEPPPSNTYHDPHVTNQAYAPEAVQSRSTTTTSSATFDTFLETSATLVERSADVLRSSMFPNFLLFLGVFIIVAIAFGLRYALFLPVLAIGFLIFRKLLK